MPPLAIDSDSDDEDSLPPLAIDDSDDEDSLPPLAIDSDSDDEDSLPDLVPDSDDEYAYDFDNGSYCDYEYYHHKYCNDRGSPDIYEYEHGANNDSTQSMSFDKPVAALNTVITVQPCKPIDDPIISLSTIQSMPIIAHIDTGSRANLVKSLHIKDTCFNNVRPCEGVTVTGIDSKAPPIPATHVGQHYKLGKVYFGAWGTNVIGVPEVLNKNMSLICTKEHMDIINAGNGKVIYRGLKNSQGLFSCDISKPTQEDNSGVFAYPTDMVIPGIKIDVPLTAIEISRATDVRKLHNHLGHPSDEVMRVALGTSLYPGIHLNMKDVENSNHLFGKCKACLEAKHKEPAHYKSQDYHTDTVGECLYIDLKQCKQTCLQKHTWMLISIDYVSGYMDVLGMLDKTTKSVYDTIALLIASYASYNHVVKRLVFDHEAVFMSVKNRFPGVVCSYTPAGLHNRRVERGIQDLLQRKRVAEAALPYHLDPKLEILGFQNAAMMHNIVPHVATPNSTPYSMMRNKQPEVPDYSFGQCVLAFIKSNGHSNNKRMEYCIFIRHEHQRDNIVFNPSTGNLLSRHDIQLSDVYPSEWKWERRAEMMSIEIPNPVNPPVPADIINNQNTTSVHLTESNNASLASSADERRSISNNIMSSSVIKNSNINPISSIQLNPTQDINDINSEPTNQSQSQSSSITTPTRTTFPSITQFIPRLNNSTPVKAAPPINIEAAHPSITQPVSPHTIIQSAITPVTPTTKAALPESSRRSSRLANKPSIDYSKINKNYLNSAITDIEYTPIDNIYSNYVQKQRLAKMKRWKIHNADRLGINVIPSYRSSVKAALRGADKSRSDQVNSAAYGECENLITNRTFHPVRRVPPGDQDCVIPSFMFIKDKTKADGSYDKTKARLVAGGNYVDTTHAGDIAAYVVNSTTVMTMLSVAALKQLNIVTADVTGAFLIPSLSDKKPEVTYIVIEKYIADMISDIVPQWEEYRQSNGTYIMLLKKALYGLPVAASKWMTHLNNTFTKMDFVVTPGDKCCWTRGSGDKKVVLCSHVDDILAIGKQDTLDKFTEELAKVYKVSIQKGYIHSYIGLDINQCRSTFQVAVSQSGYRKDVANRFKDLIDKCSDSGRVPCNEELLSQIPSEELPAKNQFLSIVMSLMYLSRFTRPDIAFAVSILSTRCSKPTRNDL